VKVQFSLDFLRVLGQSLRGVGGSFSGRTTGSGPVNRGSNPRPPAKDQQAVCIPERNFHILKPAGRHLHTAYFYLYGVPSSSGLGCRPLTPETRVRVPLGPPGAEGGDLCSLLSHSWPSRRSHIPNDSIVGHTKTRSNPKYIYYERSSAISWPSAYSYQPNKFPLIYPAKQDNLCLAKIDQGRGEGLGEESNCVKMGLALWPG
jgi:hypothetical protein